MSVNILLIIIIVLLVLGLILQIFQFLAIMTLPDNLLDAFLDSSNLVSDVIDVEAKEPSFQPKPRGFGKSKRKKRTKQSASNTDPKIPTEDSAAIVVETEIVG